VGLSEQSALFTTIVNISSRYTSPGERHTVFRMHVLDLPNILPSPDNIVVELIPERDGCDTRTGEFCERMEVEPVDNEEKGVYEEEEDQKGPDGEEVDRYALKKHADGPALALCRFFSLERNSRLPSPPTRHTYTFLFLPHSCPLWAP
jgi:hypothetical protein